MTTTTERTTTKRRKKARKANGQAGVNEPPTSELNKREILAALRALKRGDFTTRLPDGFSGIDGDICEAFNQVVTLNETFELDAAAVCLELGKQGRTKRRLRRNGAQGGFARTVGAINELLDDLTRHSTEVSRVMQAVAQGDLSQQLEVDAAETPLQGDFLRSARVVNAMVDRLSRVNVEVTRVAREVGSEGKLGAQAHVPGLTGAWKELTENVNLMASNLTSQVREIALVTTAVAQGDLTKAVTIDAKGEILELKRTINTMVQQLSAFSAEVIRVARDVGTEGSLGGQARVRDVSGVWRELTDSVNSMANNLTLQVRNISEVARAIAEGDLSKTITVEVKGEMLALKVTINRMVEQLGSFADEVTRVAREVGSEGKLGGQAEVRGVSGVWKELTESVNTMGSNLTDQVRNIAEVVTAIAQGDLGHKITVEARGEILTLKNTINATVDKLSRFSSEVTRVVRLLGTEGTLGVAAEVRDVSGVWKELTDNVNTMGHNLTAQVRDIAAVTTAVANGDLSKKITVEVRGEILTLKNTINAMVDSLSSFADEVTRMAREVGTEGVLGGQANVHDVSGIWKELTDNVNSMAANLTNQVRNLAEVATAVANGDLSRKITVDARGEVQDLKATINAMVDQLNAFAAEVTRVAREVGTEGKLGGQAEVKDGRGIWKELTDNVNLMSLNVTNQVRDVALVTTAIARGDLTQKITVDARGEILDLKNTINTVVDQLGSFADEVTRLASEVGIEGKLGGQADVRGVSGTWRDLTDAVNSMARNLTEQVRNISQVAAAIAQGDLDKKIVVDARGEILELKNTINTMVDQLSAFAEEVTRVAREVGTEGKLGGQASVAGVKGTWKELTDNVNQMGSNLTAQVRDIARVASAIARGDLANTVTVEVQGELLDLKNTINTMVDQLSSFADEVARVARDVGVEGKLGGQADVRGVSGIWKELTDNVNLMAENLTDQVRDIATVTTAVANGDLSRKIVVEARGELLDLKNTINTMVEQLRSFADEVTRVAREVGTEGILGGQAEVRGVSGTWRELTDNVNVMADNLTEQVRGIARVVTAVARGDLKKTLTLDARGEIAALVETINSMIVTLSTFADQVTSVARDVGVEGKLGGQADVPGAAGIWRDLTNNVNELAGNLTRQVRAIGDVATAVTKGDLTQSITVEARGEVALLKDNLNQMIGTLAQTTQQNKEQDWLKTNLTRFTRMLQGQRDLLSVANQVLSELAPVVGAQHGAFYMAARTEEGTTLRLFSSYAHSKRKDLAGEFAPGEGLVGQAALEKKRIVLTEVPPDYVQISSALGHLPPLNIAVVPIPFEGDVKGVIELASFHEFSPIQLDFLDQLLESLGIVVATIEATMRTDELLRQSQSLAEELQTQQEELQQTNEELEEKARQLTEQKTEVERKNNEVELAKQELEEKAEQLALTSRYKSEFLANMSHELRTPLNSLLILSRQLSQNIDQNLSEKQVESANTIHQCGADLLRLINDVLDLAKVESGTMVIDPAPIPFSELAAYIQRSFQQIAVEKGLDFGIEIDDKLPVSIVSDDMRLRQILRNLLSNALKFTDSGSVHVRIAACDAEDAGLEPAVGGYVSFAVTDTGIGIPGDKQRIVFEAFQQADGGTSRRYGGTGLGLSISRELANLLNGVLRVTSDVGEGSTFTLYLPLQYVPRPLSERAPPRLEGKTGEFTRHERLTPTNATALFFDDRGTLRPGDRVLLVVEDDEPYARLLMGIGRERGFKVVIATDGASALELARLHKPDGITLDLKLPDMDGWVLLDQLKHDASTRHIPVHVISAVDAEHRALERGARSFISKPTARSAIERAMEEIRDFRDNRAKRLLIVEDDETQRESLARLVESDDIEVVTAADAEDALAKMKNTAFDCVVVDLSLPGMTGTELIRAMKDAPGSRRIPIVVYTGKELSREEDTELRALAESVIVKDVRSAERLLEETALFLHRVEQELPPEHRDALRRINQRDPLLEGRKVLVVDDDVRNIFSITSLLEQHRMQVVYAENGKQALERLEAEGDVDLVLMDIMMPEMDGYEATRRLRAQPKYQDLPIIALTAKAMKGDREKCLDAGASDYITKPVDMDQLVSLLRVWLYR